MKPEIGDLVRLQRCFPIGYEGELVVLVSGDYFPEGWFNVKRPHATTKEIVSFRDDEMVVIIKRFDVLMSGCSYGTHEN